ESLILRLRLQTEAPNHVDRLDQHEGDGESEDGGDASRDRLDLELFETGVGPRLVDRLDAENAGQQRAEEAADAVDAESIERIIVLEEGLQANDGIANDARQQSDGQRAERPDEAGGRRHGDEAGDEAGGQA